jgi:hypothetical protein
MKLDNNQVLRNAISFPDGLLEARSDIALGQHFYENNVITIECHSDLLRRSNIARIFPISRQKN